VVSHVQALATSRDLLTTAFDAARISRSPDQVAKDMVVTGLGSSALVDLAYTDQDPDVAQQVATAVVDAVIARIDAVRIGGLPDVLRDIDNQLAELAAKRAPIAAEAQANPKDPVAQNRLAGVDRLISDLSADRNRLSEEAAAIGHSILVTTPTRPREADSQGLPAKLGVATILGLALGLILVGLNETIRPAVSGVSRVGRLLDVPTLGRVRSDPVTLAEVGRHIRLAARRANITAVVLVRASRAPLSPELVDRVEAATLRPDAVLSRIAIPIDSRAGGIPEQRTVADSTDGRAVAVLTMSENSGHAARLHRVGALDELDPSAEGERIGVVVLVGPTTRLTAVHAVRDLLAASGWPLLGVLGDAKRAFRGRGRR
jgi:hypothetical protein